MGRAAIEDRLSVLVERVLCNHAWPIDREPSWFREDE